MCNVTPDPATMLRIEEPDVSGVLPKHNEIGRSQRLLYAVAIFSAVVLLTWNVGRLAFAPVPFSGVLLLVSFAGLLAADFASGLIHWLADTWGNERMPIVGRRFLHSFRVHHVNPDDLIRRSFLDANGDVALLTVPVLAIGLFIPLDLLSGQSVAVFLVAFAGLGLFTNQIHQWAHMPKPPAPVRLLQRGRLILNRDAHADHHMPPYSTNYCITTGWCNKPLAAIRFFCRLEMAVTWLTGVQPRQDDAAFHTNTPAAVVSIPPTGRS